MIKGRKHLGNSLGAIKLVERRDSPKKGPSRTSLLITSKCNKSASSNKARPIEKDHHG